MNVLIAVNPKKQSCHEYVKRAEEFLAENGARCRTVGFSTAERLREIDVLGADMALVFGGDGTILRACRELLDYGVPVMGVNMGRLGYLAAAEPSNLIPSLQTVIEGRYFLEERVTIETVCGGKSYRGINEAVLYRGGNPHLLDIKVDVNGQEIDVIRADGIMAATPTGSTAYNLSAGGPVIVPTAENLVITPICAHSISSRPIVVAKNDAVVFTPVGGAPYLSVDGKDAGRVAEGTATEVKIGSSKIKLIRTEKYGFFQSLRKKLSGQY